MNLNPYLSIPAEENVHVSLPEEKLSKRTASSARRAFIFIAAILFIGLLGLLSVVDLKILFLDAVSTEKNVHEKTFYDPRGTTQGDLYLLGVGKADITGFVDRHY